MKNTEIIKLNKEIAVLKKELASLKELQNRDFKETHKLIKEVYTNAYQRIADLYDIVWPIEDKVLPNARRARFELKAILGTKKLGAGTKLDKRGD